jgi:hypothetical protein
MRTTLTIDDDVAAELERLRRDRDIPYKTLVNEALRAGLRAMQQQPRPRTAFRTRSVDVGDCLVGNLDNTAEVLAIAEGDAFR